MLSNSKSDNLLYKKFSKKNFEFHLKCFIVSIVVFIITIILSSLYTGGDLHVYNKVYEKIPTLSFFEGRAYYTKYLTSREVAHFFLVSIFSRIIEKTIFIALSNFILAYITMILFRKWKISFVVSAITVLTNYYIYVLYLPAERLKFGFLFIVLALIYIDSRKKFLVFSLLSVTAHFQMFLQYASLLFELVISKLKMIIFQQKLSISILLVTLISLLVFIEFKVHIMHKMNVAISNAQGISEIYRGLIFFGGALIYSKDKKQVIYCYIPLIIASYFLGGSRVNMISYFVFLYFAFPIKNGFNLAVLVTTLYFGYKNILFVNKIVLYGNGF